MHESKQLDRIQAQIRDTGGHNTQKTGKTEKCWKGLKLREGSGRGVNDRDTNLNDRWYMSSRHPTANV